MKVLVTAGPTREPIDLVRFISNRSSGRMGYAIAAAAVRRKFDTVLVSGPVALPPVAGARLIRVTTASEMAAAVEREFADADLTIMAAAVADFRPKNPFGGKLKKAGREGLVLELERTVDILLALGEKKRADQVLVGFAAESENLEENALKKLVNKKLDFIVANDVSAADRGFECATNQVTIYGGNAPPYQVAFGAKEVVAEEIVKYLTGESK